MIEQYMICQYCGEADLIIRPHQFLDGIEVIACPACDYYRERELLPHEEKREEMKNE